MASMIYRCPMTGLNVQGWVEDEGPATDLEDTFVPMVCTACARTHLVHAVTGKVLAADSD
jgi:hypothetical protein